MVKTLTRYGRDRYLTRSQFLHSESPEVPIWTMVDSLWTLRVTEGPSGLLGTRKSRVLVVGVSVSEVEIDT